MHFGIRQVHLSAEARRHIRAVAATPHEEPSDPDVAAMSVELSDFRGLTVHRN